MSESFETSAGLHCTAEQLCEMNGISRRMFFNALKVHRTGCEELKKQVRDGGIPMDLALSIAEFDHDGQRLILAELPSMKPRERAGFVRRVKLIRELELANG